MSSQEVGPPRPVSAEPESAAAEARAVDRPTLIQLVPRRAAEPNGVADYALALARALDVHHGIRSVFLSATPTVHATPVQDEWRTVSLPRRQGRILADTIRSLSAETRAGALLLHFSGYGYQNRGVPLWLAHGLRLWRQRAGRMPLITTFHELYATGRPWQSAFWLSPVQRQIARGILALSSVAITSTNLHSRRLSGWEGGGDKIITAMPVFSNVGEPGCGAAPCARDATAVVFGLAGVEDRLFGIYRPEVERAVSTLGIRQIVDVGPRLSPMPGHLAGVPFVSKGPLPQRAVSDLLHRARFGFVAYPVDVIGKSGVFAAYAAHGVVPIVLSDEKRQASLDGLRSSQHFLDGLRLADVDAHDLASIQGELFAWYQSHSLKVQADFLARSIFPGARQASARA